MTPLDLARAFVEKGREDETLLDRMLDDQDISDSIYGFHAQQAAEKYLKAVLAVDQERPERTHDLDALAQQCEDAGHPLPGDLQEIFDLSDFAVSERYPLAEMPPIDRQKALDLVRALREWVQEILESESP